MSAVRETERRRTDILLGSQWIMDAQATCGAHNVTRCLSVASSVHVICVLLSPCDLIMLHGII